MFFRRKQQEGNKKELTSEDIQGMIEEGMNDKDIIKNLKGKGYSYEEIERVMLSAVKNGVQQEPKKEFEPVPQPEPQAPEPPQPEPQEEKTELPNPADFDTISESNIEDISPETIVEELVEGVVEDKWKKFDTNIDKVKNEIENLKNTMRDFEERPSEKMDMTNYDSKVKEIDVKVNDLSIRIGGLEKAFKQFLPSLTHNIDNLSSIIKEMKNDRK